MATSNPYATDDSKGGAWEQGYLAGFNNPHDDPYSPLAPELLDIYKEGFASGSDNRAQPPEEGESWLSALADFVVEEGALHAVGVGLEKVGIEMGGVIGIVLSVVQIPGDVQLKPLEEDWKVPANRPGDTYVPVCPRNDHGASSSESTPDGYWIGAESEDFLTAANDRAAHGHPEAFVAVCAPNDGACGPVWPVVATP